MIAVVSLLSILGWAIPALVMANKGFSVQDEGSYVLSYRWWDTNPYFVSGAQLFYGPLFDALHYNIAALRVIRLVMVIASNAGFGWVFASWLARQRMLPISLQRRASITLLLTASGGATYLWSPLTPGYYDLTSVTSLGLVALMLSALARGARPSLWNAALVGFLAVVLVLTKWSAISIVLITQVVVVAALLRASRTRAARHLSTVVLGVAATAVVCQLFLFRLDRVVPALAAVSALTVTGNHSLTHLMGGYLASTAILGLTAALGAAPMLMGYLVAVRYAQRGDLTVARRWVLVGVILTGLLPALVGWHGGRDHGRVMVGIALAALLSSLIAATGARVPRPRLARPSAETTVMVVLLVVPLAQAAGTNVPLLYVSVECLAMWVAIVVVLASRQTRPRIAVFGVATYLAVLVTVVGLISGTTTLLDPFKTTGVIADQVPITGLGGLELAPLAARQSAALRGALRPYLIPEATPVLALDELAGLTYEVGGVPIGSTWNDPGSVERTAGILDLACRNGDVDPGQEPILIVRSALNPEVIEALRSCGFDYPTAFQRLAIPGGPTGILVFVPAGQP
jgi:hypothetical protein